jgi:NAD(P)-dependent dehydrogenase (short-subunit alcohol dehydrogenase family)
MTLEGQRVLVIGGGSGIGYAVAEAAAGEGAHVTVASRELAKVRTAAERLGNHAEAADLDVTDEAQVAAFFAGGRAFDHIVTTAGDWGGPRRTPVVDMDLGEAAAVFKVRFWGAVMLAKHGAKALPPGGSLTLTDGMIAHRPSKGSALSSAMAGAIEHLTRGLAVELAPIRVNCVCPGLIRTGVWNLFMPDEAQRQAQLDKMTARQLVPRAGDPAETAEAYLYLMKGGYTTGQVLHVEGGSALAQ